MHEAAAMQGVVGAILERASQAGGGRVERVRLVVGRSGHLTEAAARQHFAVLVKGTPAEDAQLSISWLPATYQCLDCPNLFESALPPDDVICPRCGGLTLGVEHLDVCYVSEIDIA